jgi:pimeloyl-ACP methyl ester carboxylesterase
MPHVNVHGAALEYVEAGHGEPLVFVHGSASDYRTWRLQQDHLARRFRVITFSRRYHWPNEPIQEGADYAMAEHIADLRALLHALDAAPAHLVGHSYGAFVCLLLAQQDPHLVRTLVLAEPPVITLFVSNRPKPMELLKLLATRPRTAAAIVKLGATGLGPATAAAKRGDMEAAMRLFGMAALGRKAYTRLSAARREQVRVNLFRAEFLGSGFLPLNEEKLRRIATPTMLLTAQSSPRVFHRLADRLEELLPQAERFEIPDASHIMHEDNAPAFTTAVQSFIEGHHGHTS